MELRPTSARRVNTFDASNQRSSFCPLVVHFLSYSTAHTAAVHSPRDGHLVATDDARGQQTRAHECLGVGRDWWQKINWDLLGGGPREIHAEISIDSGFVETGGSGRGYLRVIFFGRTNGRMQPRKSWARTHSNQVRQHRWRSTGGVHFL